jgi:CelD/BcsL family acetyltransferase involved in cellulose biosynthesis
VVVQDAGRPAVIFPTAVGRWNAIPTVRFLGDPLIQYGDVVAAPDTAPELLEAAWRAATGPSGAWLILLRKVRADARIAPVLARNARVMAEYEAPFVDVRQPPAASAHYRKELRRFRRRLAEMGELRFETLHGSAARQSIDEALRMKQDWLAARGMPSAVIGDPDWEQAVIALASAGDGPGKLHAARLTVGGRPAAIEIGFVHGSRWHAFLGALAPGFAKAGPGHVQMADTVEHCRTAGLATYDLLAPSDAYKRLVAHGAVPVRDHAAPIGPGGWLGLLAARAMPAVKRMFALVPPQLRRALIALRRSEQPPRVS